jgi:HEAT repeat protein
VPRDINPSSRPGLVLRGLLGALSGVLPAAGLLTAPALVCSGAAAQADAERSNEELLANFIHFIKIARYDVAAGEAGTLLDSGITPEQFVDLVDASGELDRFQSSVARALRVEAVQDVAARLDEMYRTGRLQRARNAEEIARNIGLLSGTMGERLAARSRLIAAGEYAVPQLLESLISGGDPALRARVQQVLIESGRQAVTPLAEALPSLSPADQERVLNVLASIPYRASLPAVVGVFNQTASSGVREAAGRVIAALGASPDAPVAGLYAELAEGYYAHLDELTSFPGEEFQLGWDYVAGIGLQMRAVPSEIFHETMSMRMAERSLRQDPSSAETLALWIASAFRREISGEGVPGVSPITDRDAMYYAVAAGPSIGQRILARALDTRDTPLARKAIAAIERTGGTDTLTGVEDGRRPLLESLTFHSRRVQLETALALARSQPAETFDGAERVVPILAAAIRDVGARFAVVLTGPDREEYDRIQGLLAGEGFTVLPPADRGVADIAGPIAEAPGVDLVVVSLAGAGAVAAHDEARAEPRLAAAPMLLLSRSADMLDLQRRFDRDRTVLVRRDVITSDQFIASMKLLVEQAAGGPIAPDEVRDYTARALAALRDLAVARNEVLSVEDAALSLIGALGDARGQTVSEIAEVLAHVGQPRAQVALLDAALDASGESQADLLGKVADSAKRFGNMLEERQIARVLRLAGDADLAVATAAAAVVGALDLPNTDLVPLITGGSKADGDNRAGR